MKAINAKSLGASLIVLVFSFITAPAAMADATMYPGSMCTHELAGSGGTLDRQSARIRTSTRGGTVVTCR